MPASALIWPIKKSFTSYVEQLADGRIDVGEGAERVDDAFVFPAADGEGNRFGGSVVCSGHFGMLLLEIRGIEVLESEDGALLTIDDEDLPEGRRTLLALHDATVDPGGRTYGLPQLTEEGAELFFDTYRAGTLFDPVRVGSDR
jgi:hypothetical protein